MSDQRITIRVPGTAELRLTTTSGRVTVTAEDRQDVAIESGAPSDGRIETDATGLVALRSPRGGSAALEVRCPAGSDVVVGTVSGKVELRGQFGRVHVTTISSTVDVERADELDVRSVSGSIEIGCCTGGCRVQTKSGRATLGSAGDAQMSTISGRIRLDAAQGDVRAHTVSGKVEVGMETAGDVAVKTMSGAVSVQVPDGVCPSPRLRSLTGRPRFECEEGDDCKINVHSLSGKIEVVPR
jgi:DUF4097 and DUF4098 domain-containing protein YvlB